MVVTRESRLCRNAWQSQIPAVLDLIGLFAGHTRLIVAADFAGC
jgi:hypothetical protein